MLRRICFGLALAVGFFLFMPPAWAQYDIAGWWSGEGIYKQGEFVTGEWTAFTVSGKKKSYLHISQGPTSNTGTAYFLIWDVLSQDYLVEIYNLFIRNNVVVLFVPTSFDTTTGSPAGATLVLKPTIDSANKVTFMKGYQTLYDLEATVTPDLFVRMGPVSFTRVLQNRVPLLAKEKLPFP